MRTKLMIFAGLLILATTACDNVTTSFGLEIGSTNFNRTNDLGEYEAVDDGVFNSGEIVYLMLFDVSGFEKDKDGLNKIEMDMRVTAADGSVIIDEKEMLGEGGHVKLDNNTAPNPSAAFTPPNELPAGEYTFFVKIYDKVNDGNASVSKKFTYK